MCVGGGGGCVCVGGGGGCVCVEGVCVCGGCVCVGVCGGLYQCLLCMLFRETMVLALAYWYHSMCQVKRPARNAQRLVHQSSHHHL